MRSLLAITLFVHRQYHLASSQYPLFTFETRLLSAATFSCPFVCCDSPNISTAMITCHYPVNSARSNSSVLHTSSSLLPFGYPSYHYCSFRILWLAGADFYPGSDTPRQETVNIAGSLIVSPSPSLLTHLSQPLT
ncbi:hypothetical protein FRC18_007441 [Serendipita sp. 400]|nr:hypothetical protein FRC18_007441 [Serendipita sp. 400]